MYKSRRTQTQFELLPATLTSDAPAVFHAAYLADYGPGSQPDGSAHPFFMDFPGAVPQVLAWQSLNQVQKLIEKAMTKDVEGILDASRSLSTPSMFHQLQFDMYGRTARVNEMLFQVR